jgi:membrane fusion protein (multidrug efflux system)
MSAPQSNPSVTIVPPAANASAPPAAPVAPLNGTPQRVRIIVGLILLCALTIGARVWWRSHFYEETDNAYLAGHVSTVAPRIAGVVTKVLVADNQLVRAGDILVELDPADQDVRVQQIKAQLAQIEAQIEQTSAQIAQTNAELKSVKAQVKHAEAQLTRAQADAERYASLHTSDMKAVSKAELDAAIAARDSAVADLHSQENQVNASLAKVSVSQASRQALEANRDVLQAQLKEAQLQQGYSRVYAPVSGRIGRKNVEIGTRVQAGQQLLAIVQDGIWVTANYKETQLPGIYPGQQASIRVDALPGQTLNGHVESFSPASGGQFSLLPPDNATGNFTKIVQRIPVKIVIDNEDYKKNAGRLAPGMSAIVEIDLRQGKPDAAGARQSVTANSN